MRAGGYVSRRWHLPALPTCRQSCGAAAQLGVLLLQQAGLARCLQGAPALSKAAEANASTQALAFRSAAVPGISAAPSEDNLRYFNVIILGPEDSPFQGGPASRALGAAACVAGKLCFATAGCEAWGPGVGSQSRSL